jgi:hypothetical protein
MDASNAGNFRTTVVVEAVVAVMTNVVVARSLAKNAINKYHTYTTKG